MRAPSRGMDGMIRPLSDIYALVRSGEVSVLEAVAIAQRRARRRRRWHGEFIIETLIGGAYTRQVATNSLYDQGEQDVLEVYFRGSAAPTDFKVGLLRPSYVMNETHQPVNLSPYELSDATAPGYATRGIVTRDTVGWPNSANVGGDWQVTTEQISWIADDAWADVAGYIFLLSGGLAAPGNTSGRILSVAALNPTRQLQTQNDVLRVTYNLRLS